MENSILLVLIRTSDLDFLLLFNQSSYEVVVIGFVCHGSFEGKQQLCNIFYQRPPSTLFRLITTLDSTLSL